MNGRRRWYSGATVGSYLRRLGHWCPFGPGGLVRFRPTRWRPDIDTSATGAAMVAP